MDHEGVEEVRERLDARSLLGERWREWWNRRRRRTQQGVALEPLDPSSARARYREFLQAVALTKEASPGDRLRHRLNMRSVCWHISPPGQQAHKMALTPRVSKEIASYLTN